jgi:hypothetical protein
MFAIFIAPQGHSALNSALRMIFINAFEEVKWFAVQANFFEADSVLPRPLA